MNTVASHEPDQKRSVGALLILGILFFPGIFVWFLLRKGHSTTARVVGFAYLAISLFLLFGVREPKIEPQPESAPEQPSTEQQSTSTQSQEPISVTASELFNAFDANEVAAEQKYKGNPIVITGSVASIDTGVMGGVTVVLSTGDEFGINQVMLNDIDRDTAAQLTKGQRIKARCVGGIAVMKIPTLNNCVLQ